MMRVLCCRCNSLLRRDKQKLVTDDVEQMLKGTLLVPVDTVSSWFWLLHATHFPQFHENVLERAPACLFR